MNYSNIEYTSESIKTLNSHIEIDCSNKTNIDIRYTPFSHHNLDTPQTTTETSQWYGIKLAKQKSWQEQRVFANHQLVRFVSSSSSSTSTDSSAFDDEEIEAITEPNNPWQFSDLAKQVSKLEQECFANSFAKVNVNVEEIEGTGDERAEWRFVDLARHWERLEQRAFAGSFSGKVRVMIREVSQ